MGTEPAPPPRWRTWRIDADTKVDVRALQRCLDGLGSAVAHLRCRHDVTLLAAHAHAHAAPPVTATIRPRSPLHRAPRSLGASGADVRVRARGRRSAARACCRVAPRQRPARARTPIGEELLATLQDGRSPFATVTVPSAVTELTEVVAELEPDLAVVCGFELAAYLDVLRPLVGTLVFDLDYPPASGGGGDGACRHEPSARVRLAQRRWRRSRATRWLRPGSSTRCGWQLRTTRIGCAARAGVRQRSPSSRTSSMSGSTSAPNAQTATPSSTRAGSTSGRTRRQRASSCARSCRASRTRRSHSSGSRHRDGSASSTIPV